MPADVDLTSTEKETKYWKMQKEEFLRDSILPKEDLARRKLLAGSKSTDSMRFLKLDKGRHSQSLVKVQESFGLRAHLRFSNSASTRRYN